MKLALIGVGRWGRNIQKTLEGLGVEVITHDTNPSRPPLVGGGVKSFPPDKGELKGVSGVLIATPGSTHAEVALPFIKKGLPVFIEKPMTTNLKDALKLQKEAKKSKSLIFVGHLHLYNPAFLKAKELIRKAGRIRYVSFEGMNWGPFREDMSAWWDWAPHDIAMALDLFEKPKSIQAWGEYDWAVARLTHPTPPLSGRGPITTLLHVTTLSSEKRKRMTVAGTKYSVVFDDTAERKIEVHKKGQVSYPEYEKTPPLSAELKAFIQMIKTKKQPKTDIQNGLGVVKILDAGERSMKSGGKKIPS